MRANLPLSILVATRAAFPCSAIAESVDADRSWPQWRGPLATGVAPHGNPPLEWDAKKNIAWKVEIPGKGYASPIVWKDTVYVLSAVPTGEPAEIPEPAESEEGQRRSRNIQPTQTQQFTILALSRADGMRVLI